MSVSAAAEPADPDPWIGMNRGLYGFNDKLDTWFLRPIASSYDKIMPDPFQQGVSNVFDNIGTPLSEEVEIVERFILSEDQTRLDFDITITDPSVFTSPAKLRGCWLALGDTIPLYDCQPLQR